MVRTVAKFSMLQTLSSSYVCTYVCYLSLPIDLNYHVPAIHTLCCSS